MQKLKRNAVRLGMKSSQTPFNTPSRDYLGHNPVLAMARLWERL